MLKSCGLADRFDFALTWERHMNYNLVEAGRDIEASTPKFPVHNRTGGRPRSFGRQFDSCAWRCQGGRRARKKDVEVWSTASRLRRQNHRRLVWGSLGVPARHSVSPRQREATMHTQGGRGSWSGDRLCSCRTAAWPLFWPVAQCEARCQKKWVLRYWFRVKWRIHSHL
jgi:hypothetical protein